MAIFTNDKNLEKKVRKILAGIKLPDGGNLADYSGLSEIIITKKALALAISISPEMDKEFMLVRQEAQSKIEKIAKGRKVMISLTSDEAQPKASKKSGQEEGAPPQAKRPSAINRVPVKGVKNIIAIASGKGGVGKSTVSVNLALALKSLGLKTGLLDADLYGPSIPKMLRFEGKPAARVEGNFTPFEVYGIKAMSIGPMIEADKAVVWRAPMVTSALRQLLRETDWGELDVLVIDLPPGTGDIQISLAQQVELAGAVIVSTPQDMALIDAKKAISMFSMMDIKIFGIVENMSYFIAPDTGNRYDIFGHGGAKKTADDLGLEFLGEVPLVMNIRETSDKGEPVVASSPSSDEAKAFLDIANKIIKGIKP